MAFGDGERFGGFADDFELIRWGDGDLDGSVFA